MRRSSVTQFGFVEIVIGRSLVIKSNGSTNPQQAVAAIS
jgi:hypothetical protein